jgi:RHS repeat-associated protein
LHYGVDNTATVTTANGGTRTYTAQPGFYRRLAQVTDSAGASAHAYHADGRPSSVTSPQGTTTTYAFTGAFLSQRIEAAGTPESRARAYQRDSNGYLSEDKESRVEPDGSHAAIRINRFVRDATGRPLHHCLIDPSVSGAEGYACGSLATPVADVRQTSYTYCSQSDVTAGTCPLVGLLRSVDGVRTDVPDITTYQYRMSNAPGCETTPAACHYRKGDLWKVTDALGKVTETLGHDGAGRPVSVTESNGVITDYEYHARGWLTARKVRGTNDATESDDLVTHFEYWPTGLVKKVTQPDGTFLSFTYDTAHRLTRITDKAGYYIEYTLDNAGNRVLEETRNPTGSTLYRTLSRLYNALGQLETQADAASNPTDFAHDASGNLTKVTDALGREAAHDYDPLDRLKRSLQDVDGLEAETAYEYDALDNLTKVTDPKGLETVYTYNGFGDLTQLASPDTGTTTYTYDSAGNRSSQTDARGVVSNYAYDALNRLTAISYPADGTYDASYTWDTVPASCPSGETFGKGRLGRLQNGNGAILEYCYDRFGQLVRKRQAVNGNALVVRYVYTKAGALQEVTYPDGMVVDYTRNGTGRVNAIGVTPAGGTRQVLISAVSNYPFGPQRRLTYGNGRFLDRAHDLDYKPTAMHDARAGGLEIGYGYDPAGQLDELHVPTSPGVQLARYRYDGLGRLDQVQDGPTGTPIETYGYDATGNRTSVTDSGGTQVYAYPSDSHRLASVGGALRGYDAAGNTTSIGGLAREFFYTPAGRMRVVKRNGAIEMYYRYNGRGEQVWRLASASDPGQSYYMYDESGRWLGEYDINGAPKQQIVWLDDLPVGLVNAAGIKYVEPDHLGTPRAVIDPVRDVAVWKWEATGEVFGDTPPIQDPDGDGYELVFDMRFPGQRYDAASGLNYNYFRDYEPTAGRYVESDPIGLHGGLSTYLYADAEPALVIDPVGLQGRNPWNSFLASRRGDGTSMAQRQADYYQGRLNSMATAASAAQSATNLLDSLTPAGQ